MRKAGEAVDDIFADTKQVFESTEEREPAVAVREVSSPGPAFCADTYFDSRHSRAPPCYRSSS